jgi:hypothetical protein
MWLARLDLRYEQEMRGNEDQSRKTYRVIDIDLDHGEAALREWNAGRVEFMRLVYQTGLSEEEAVSLDREFQAILLAADAVARGLSVGWVDDGDWDDFRYWERALERFDEFEDRVALSLAAGQPTAQNRLQPVGGGANLGSRAPGVDKIEAGEDSVGNSPARLTNRAKDLLVAMLELNAISEAKQRTRAIVVEKVNPYDAVEDYVRAFRELKWLGFYDSTKGPEGGVWLTQAGLNEARRLKGTPV